MKLYNYDDEKSGKSGYSKQKPGYINWKRFRKEQFAFNVSSLNKRIEDLANVKPSKIKRFTSLPLSEEMLNGLKRCSFVRPTMVQQQSLVHTLRGSDTVVAAKTGSGKTLPFVITILEALYKDKFTINDGLGALVITPTRELAFQIYQVFSDVGDDFDLSLGLIIGKQDLKHEWLRIYACNIIVATPGRLLQHMTANPNFDISKLKILVLDEADQSLSLGFADEMTTLLDELPRERQTLLFSATQTEEVDDLIRAGCRDPVFVSAHARSDTLTPKGLKESYVVLEDYEKLTFLYSFISFHKTDKIMVFVSTKKQVKFYQELMQRVRVGTTVLSYSGLMKESLRLERYKQFCSLKSGVLVSTSVAARGLDFKVVDWVVQLDCPDNTTDYIHRVGRTARHLANGNAVLVLTPSQEEPMLALLQAKGLIIDKIDFKDRFIMSGLTAKAEVALTKHKRLAELGFAAFKAYLWRCVSHLNKQVFDVKTIDLEKLSRSFGLGIVPKVTFVDKQLARAEKKKLRQQKEAASRQGDDCERDQTNEGVKSEESGDSDYDSDDSYLKRKTKKRRREEEEEELDDEEKQEKEFKVKTVDSDSDSDFLLRCSSPEPDEDERTTAMDALALYVKEGSVRVSKEALVRKAKRSGLQLNKRIVFHSDDEQDKDKEEKEEKKEKEEIKLSVTSADAASGIDIDRMKASLQARDGRDKRDYLADLRRAQSDNSKMEELKTRIEDALENDEEFDPEKIAREIEENNRKKKAKKEVGVNKESDEEEEVYDFETQAIIDELPDPDELYSKEGEKCDGAVPKQREKWGGVVPKRPPMQTNVSSDAEPGLRQLESDLHEISVDEKAQLALLLLKGAK